MKAVRIHQFGGPEVLTYEDAPEPHPDTGQVVVRVAAASVNPIDAAVRSGAFRTPRQLPFIIGSDGAGTVTEVASDVSGIAVGDEVLFSGLGIGMEGSYADYVVLHAVQAVPKPKNISFAEAAALGLAFTTAYYALVHRGALRSGETVLVQGGSGGVGTASIQLASALGARVLATVGHDEAIATLKELGAEAVINYRTADVVAAVRDLTDGKGVALVHELATSDNVRADLALIAKGGRIVCTGPGSKPEAVVPVGEAISRDASILFMSTSNAGRAGVATMLREVAQLAEKGAVRAVIGETLPLSEARRAHEILAEHHMGKIVLLP
jgi:NADPH2:quinone reductase